MNFTSQNPQLNVAKEFVENTSRNLFLTGKAGTGKTTLLHNLRKQTFKRTVVVAPTGVAAINAGGVTIHSFFQLPFGPQVPRTFSTESPFSSNSSSGKSDNAFVRMSRDKKNIIRSMDLLVIDEISMVRADLLDAIDAALRRYRRTTQPFGGVQLLMIGDLQQLAPVVKEDEWQMLREYYDSPFFFSSRAIREAGFESIELKHVYRQSDQRFIDLLNRVRENKLDSASIAQLNERFIPNFTPEEKEGYITLTTHNNQARQINEKKLNALTSEDYKFQASVTGDFPEYAFPTEEELILKTGAQVMFVKNDSSGGKRYYNGKIGKVVEVEDGIIFVQCPGEDEPIDVSQDTWQNMKYTVNPDNQEIEEKQIGSFTQYPLKLAWAITIHKSQGLTFEKAIIDAQAAFAHGQVYVALSRCRTLEGMVLTSKINSEGIFSNNSIEQFNRRIEENEPDENRLIAAQADYQYSLLADLFNFKLLYSRLQYCLKQASQNQSSLLGDPLKHLQECLIMVQEKLINVAEKFLQQVNASRTDTLLLIESNPKLQERISKGCVHFITVFENEFNPIYDLVQFSSDNKAVTKTLSQAADQVNAELQVKYAGLEACKGGFNVRKFMEARAKAALEKPSTKKSGKIEAEIALADIKYPEVFNQLKEWRHKQAIEQGLPHYMILTQKALAAVAQFLPASTSDLKKIKGIGKRTIEKFGDAILNITISYREEKNIDLKMPEMQTKSKKEPKKPTREVTFELFQEGKSPEEIADTRSLTLSTIQGHLAHYVGEGVLEVEQFVDEEKLSTIAEYFHQNKDTQLNDAKQALGETITYADLRFVLKYMQHTGQL